MSELIDNATGEIIPSGLPERSITLKLNPMSALPIGGEVFSNIPSDRAHMALLINASSNKGCLASDVLGQTLNLKWVYAHQVLRESADRRESVIGWRMALITAERQIIVTSGPAVHRAISDLVKVAGPGPWEPPIPVRIEACKGKDGHKYHILTVVEPATPIPTAQPVRGGR